MRRSNSLVGVQFHLVTFFIVLTAFFFMSEQAFAFAPITLRYQHHLYTLDPDLFPAWQEPQEIWRYRGVEIMAPQALRVDGDNVPPLPEGMTRTMEPTWNTEAMRATVQERISSSLDRPALPVTISRSGSGQIIFDGVGMLGRQIDLDRATQLMLDALARGVTDIELPVEELQPEVRVTDAELTRLGIKEVVTVGESDFTGSPLARRHNINVGLSKFNGHIIPQGDTFSFNEVLGPVDASTGYKKELVILGEKTLPDYGGGLCQVSTTAYRGIWEYGFPITDRRNHSYSVRYYGPQGTDATIYPPSTDMKFVNDSPGAILIQTHVEGDEAFFIYYGSRDERKTDVIGPYLWGRVNPPPDKTEMTLEIPPGTTRVVGKAVPGTSAAWFRVLRAPGSSEEEIESYYSIYEARPNFTQIGVESLPPEAEAGASSSSSTTTSAATSS